MLHPTTCVMQDNAQVLRDLLSRVDHHMTAVCNSPEDARSVLQQLVGMKRDLGILQEGYEVRWQARPGCIGQLPYACTCSPYVLAFTQLATGFQQGNIVIAVSGRDSRKHSR